MMARLRESPRRLDEVAPDVRWPDGLQGALDGALALEPVARFGSAGDFASAVETSVAVQTSVEIPPDRPDASESRRSRRWTLPAVAATVILLVAVAAIRAFDTRPPEESAASPQTIAATAPSSSPAPTLESRGESIESAEAPPAAPETAISTTEPPPRTPPEPPPAEAAPPAPNPAGVAELDSYRTLLRPDLPPDSARMAIADLERLLDRLKTRRDSVEADIYRAEAHALAGDHDTACALLESARHHATPLQRQKMELWVEQGLCQSADWQSS